MSAKNAKQARRAHRAELGISKAAERAQHEFDAEVARLRRRLNIEHEAPIIRLDNRRRALAWVVLALFFVAIGLCLAAAFGVR